MSARAREIGRPPTAPLLATLASGQPVLTEDGQDGRTDGRDVSKTDTVKTHFDALVSAIRSGAVIVATHRKSDAGDTFIFRVQPAGVMTPDERFAVCLKWMRDHQITNRAAFFAGCPEAGTNCALHHRCITQLKREGLIERIGREYVFKEQQ